MSNRKNSLKRIKKLDRATSGRSGFTRYSFDGEDTEATKLNRYYWILIAFGISALVVAAVILWLFFGSTGDDAPEEQTEIYESNEVTENVATDEDDEEDTDEIVPGATMSGVATFLQGPRGWKKKKDWAGYWGDAEIDGRRFGGFGCGLCVMANFYSSLTPYQCSPVDIYEYAKEVSGYEGAGAIDWPHIATTLEKLGFQVDTGRKPKKYREFQELIEEAPAAMVVISSYYDDSYWKSTPGQYVTLFGYNAEEDTVFLGDSGDLKHNRSRIPLRTVYKAIKKSNALHYLRVLSYDEQKDEWKHTTISGKWVRPDYWDK